MTRPRTLVPARQDDGTIYWIPGPVKHRLAVTLSPETTPMLMALLETGSLTASQLIHAALLAVWLARGKKPAPPARPTQT